MRAVVIALVSCVAVAASGCGESKSGGRDFPACGKTQPEGFPVSAAGLAIGDTAPDLQVTDMDGNTHCTRDYSGQVVLLNIGAGWCGPCQYETPDIQAVYAELHDSGFEVLMALYEDEGGGDPDQAFMEEWKTEYGVTFPLIPDTTNAMWDTYHPAGGANGIPYNVILDKDQVIRYSDAGAMSDTFLRNRVLNYLDDPSLEY